MNKPNLIKKPNHTQFKTNLRYPKVMDGINRLYQYTDGVVHKVMLGDVRGWNEETKEFETHKGATHLKRVSQRSSVIRKTVRQFQKRKKHETNYQPNSKPDTEVIVHEEANTKTATGGVVPAGQPSLVGE